MSLKLLFDTIVDKRFLISFVIALYIGGVCPARATSSEKPVNTNRYRVFALKNISAEQGIKYLSKLDIGTVSRIPRMDTLLVTASPEQLLKTSAVIKIVDSNEEFRIRQLCPASQSPNLPSNEQIAAEVGDISIGTFSEPPENNKQTRAIIDIHNDSVIAIAPANKIEKILSAVKKAEKKIEQTSLDVEFFRPAANAKPVKSKIIELPEDKIAEPETIKPVTIEEKAKKPIAGEVKIIAAPEGSVEDEVSEKENGSDELFSDLIKSITEVRKDKEPEKAAEPNEQAQPLLQKEKKAKETKPSEVAAEPEPLPEPVEKAEKAEDEITEPLKELPELIKQAIVEALKEKELAEEKKVAEKEKPETKVSEKPRKIRSYEPEPIIDGNETLDLVLPEKLNIIDLLALAGEYLKLDYMYDPLKVKGEVAFKLQGQLSGKIKLKDLYPLVEGVMQFQGFAMSRKGNLVTIVPKAEALENDPKLIDTEQDKVEYGDVIVTRVFQLEHIDVADAKNMLDGLKLGADINTSITGSKTFIVTGYAKRMSRIERLLELIDKPGKPKTFRFRQLKYTMAVNLVPKVESLAEQLGTVSISVGAAPEQAQPAGRPQPTRRGRPTPPRRIPPSAGKPTPDQADEPTVYLDADERTNRVLMIGLAEQLDEVEQLIDSLDVEKQDLRMLRLYEIQYVGAEEVMEKLGQLGVISSTIGRTTTRRSPTGRTTPTKAETPQSSPLGNTEPLTDEPQVVIIEATNSLLVNATPEQHTQIAVIISYVDSETQTATIPYVVYPLENQDPLELAETLNQLIRETVDTQQKPDKAGKVTSTTPTIGSKFEEDITILPDEGTFSLIVYASKKNQIWIESLIKKLDMRRPQVLLDVTLVQITKDDAFTFALDALAAVPDAAFVSGQLLTDPGEDAESLFEKIANAPDRGKFLEFASISSGDAGDYKGFYGNEKISALITAVQEQGYGRVMARPKLLVNDNEEGEIKTTKTTYITRQSTSYVPTGGTSASPGLTNQALQSQTFDDYSAGLTLNIKPHISAGDMLRLEITLNRSDFTGDLGEEKPPDKTDEDVSTIVTVPNKSTIILGGVENIRSSRGGKKVPLLGDIPLIGGLFRNVARSDRHNKLYIFVKAYILRPGGEFALDDLREVSQKNRRNFEELEDEMNRQETWPGTKPTPLDPLRVLEAD